MTILMPNSTTLTEIVIEFWITGDDQHYAPPPTIFLYSWNLLSITVDSYAIFQNGIELNSNRGQFPLQVVWSTCRIGRHFTEPRFMTGRIASLQFYDRSLANGELYALWKTRIQPMWNSPMEFEPVTPPPFFLNGLSLPMHLYPSPTVGGVPICVHTVPAGFMSPSNLT
jgi:hypothetical protein